ncbi:helix-turn-helix domain-containing protein [Nonomuraea fuscirosea]|uniref:helix-turn-helix domain-containing protein n=1 Tax=Nonomuraea fuscirosea TaxID=1291556 RepID=UPI00341AA897
MGDEPSGGLADRLRELREQRWPGQRISQAQLSSAMKVSVPSISSWETGNPPRIPPQYRLERYAIFFATKRSVADGVVRLLPLSELTTKERDEQTRLLNELTQLRKEALNRQSKKPVESLVPSDQDTPPKDPWHFSDGGPITIICSQVPEQERATIPYASPTSVDYISLYKYSDLDSLFELYGHLRAANPDSKVTLRATEDLSENDLTTHVALLGGVDYNEITTSMVRDIRLPVQQVPDWDGEKGPYFEVNKQGDSLRFYPSTVGSGDDLRLIEDVGFFYRGINPDNTDYTLTICNGMYARGVYGAVRALTDIRFRDRNAAFLRERFGAAESYSILMRVRIRGRVAVTPDWTFDRVRLHEWSEAPADDG